MGNTTTKDVGNFQAGVGKVDADMSLIGAWIFAVILVILALVFASQAFVARKPSDCMDDDQREKCQHKSKQWGFLFALLLIPLAVFIVWYAKWWKHEVYTNRTAAQIGGTMAEANWINQAMHPNN